MVQLSTALVFAAVALGAFAQDTPAGITDDVILQYALTLEHLESAFYAEALGKLTADQFAAGGEQYELFQQINQHEASHVVLLSSVLGEKATKACNYSFPYTDVQGFKALAQVLEGVGVSAYLGAAKDITNPAYVTAAGSILTIESRHAAWLASTNGENPFPGSNDTPLDYSQVFSLAASFITGCPSTNPELPVKAFPSLTASNGTNLKSGQDITFTVGSGFNASSAGNHTLYAAFLNGLTPLFVPYTINSSVTIPADIKATGTVYVLITRDNKTVTDDSTLAGPAILHFNAGFTSLNVVPGSSTGSGSGQPGTDSNGNPAGNGGSTTPDAAGSLAWSATAAFVGALAVVSLL